MQSSGRIGETDWMKPGWFLPWRNLVQFFVPDFFGNPATLNYWGIWNYGEFIGYIGIAGIIFAISGLITYRIRRKGFWILILGTALLFALPNPVSQLVFRLNIPVLSVLQPTRLMALIDLSLAILAAYGFDAITSDSGKNFRKSLITAAAVFIGISMIVFIGPYVIHNPGMSANLEISRRNSILPLAFFMLISGLYIFTVLLKKSKKIRQVFPYIILTITVIDLFRFGWKFTPFTDGKLFFPETKTIEYLQKQAKPFRVMPVDDLIFSPNTLMYYGIESVSGYDPLYFSRYEELIAAMERGQPDIKGPFGFNRIVTPKNVNSPVFRLINPEYVLTLDPIHDARFSQVFTEGETRVYQNKAVLPRVYLVPGNLSLNSKQAEIDAIYARDFDPSETAITENAPQLISSPLLDGETFHLVQYNDDRLSGSVDCRQSRWLFIGNIDDPGWRAKIDGKPAKIYLTDYAFMGIVIPPGTHNVELKYLPSVL
jgi:hypothetical protein